MASTVVIVVFLMSLASWPLSVALSRLQVLKNERYAIAAAAALFVAALVVIFLLFRRYFRKLDPFMYVFSIFCVDALGSLGNALEADGYIGKFKFQANLTDVEPYLKTAHGTMFSYWHGTVHFILALSAIALYTRRDSHREVVLYWAGSVLNSVVVLLPACLTSRDSIKSPTAAGVILLLISICVLFYYIDKRPVQARSFLKSSPIWKRPVDLFFLIFFDAAIIFAVFKGLAVLDAHSSCFKDYLRNYEPYLRDPSGFPKFQALTYEYLFIVYYFAAAYGLLSPGQHWMADWSLVHAGAAAQAQFSYISGSLHSSTSRTYRSPQTGTPAIAFWVINLVMFIVPHLFAFWCQRDPENFGRTYTMDLASPVQTLTYTTQRRSARLHKKGD